MKKFPRSILLRAVTAGVALASGACSSGGASGRAPAMESASSLPPPSIAARQLSLLSRLPTLPGLTRASEVRQPELGRLADWLADYCRGQYEVTGRLFFLAEKSSFQWVAIEKTFASALHDTGIEATRELIAWHSPGIDLVRIYRTEHPARKFLAVAALREPAPPGQVIVGYFELNAKADASAGPSQPQAHEDPKTPPI